MITMTETPPEPQHVSTFGTWQKRHPGGEPAAIREMAEKARRAEAARRFARAFESDDPTDTRPDGEPDA